LSSLRAAGLELLAGGGLELLAGGGLELLAGGGLELLAGGARFGSSVIKAAVWVFAMSAEEVDAGQHEEGRILARRAEALHACLVCGWPFDWGGGGDTRFVSGLRRAEEVMMYSSRVQIPTLFSAPANMGVMCPPAKEAFWGLVQGHEEYQPAIVNTITLLTLLRMHIPFSALPRGDSDIGVHWDALVRSDFETLDNYRKELLQALLQYAQKDEVGNDATDSAVQESLGIVVGPLLHLWVVIHLDKSNRFIVSWREFVKWAVPSVMSCGESVGREVTETLRVAAGMSGATRRGRPGISARRAFQKVNIGKMFMAGGGAAVVGSEKFAACTNCSHEDKVSLQWWTVCGHLLGAKGKRLASAFNPSKVAPELSRRMEEVMREEMTKVDLVLDNFATHVEAFDVDAMETFLERFDSRPAADALETCLGDHVSFFRHEILYALRCEESIAEDSLEELDTNLFAYRFVLFCAVENIYRHLHAPEKRGGDYFAWTVIAAGNEQDRIRALWEARRHELGEIHADNSRVTMSRRVLHLLCKCFLDLARQYNNIGENQPFIRAVRGNIAYIIRRGIMNGRKVLLRNIPTALSAAIVAATKRWCVLRESNNELSADGRGRKISGKVYENGGTESALGLLPIWMTASRESFLNIPPVTLLETYDVFVEAWTVKRASDPRVRTEVELRGKHQSQWLRQLEHRGMAEYIAAQVVLRLQSAATLLRAVQLENGWETSKFDSWPMVLRYALPTSAALRAGASLWLQVQLVAALAGGAQMEGLFAGDERAGARRAGARRAGARRAGARRADDAVLGWLDAAGLARVGPFWRFFMVEQAVLGAPGGGLRKGGRHHVSGFKGVVSQLLGSACVENWAHRFMKSRGGQQRVGHSFVRWVFRTVGDALVDMEQPLLLLVVAHAARQGRRRLTMKRLVNFLTREMGAGAGGAAAGAGGAGAGAGGAGGAGAGAGGAGGAGAGAGGAGGAGAGAGGAGGALSDDGSVGDEVDEEWEDWSDEDDGEDDSEDDSEDESENERGGGVRSDGGDSDGGGGGSDGRDSDGSGGSSAAARRARRERRREERREKRIIVWLKEMMKALPRGDGVNALVRSMSARELSGRTTPNAVIQALPTRTPSHAVGIYLRLVDSVAHDLSTRTQREIGAILRALMSDRNPLQRID